jgi:glycosyltransferase involved in cell wall biosynthesis
MEGYKMIELSVICPTLNEWPQIAFTIRSVYEELRDRVDFEIILVDNSFCKEVEEQGRKPDRTFEYFQSMSKGWSWLKVMKYEEKMSHWNAKRVGVLASQGKFIWFVDAHVIISRDALYKQFCYYRDHYMELDGVLHLPVTYHIMEYHKLMYKLVTNLPEGQVHYSFTPYRDSGNGKPFRVPCMTTDGMMITRELYDYMGGIPSEMGIWGGGENFINFTLAVLGKNVWIMPGNSLNHHGDKRGYAYNYDDLYRNRAIASFIYGGEDLVRVFTNHYKGSQEHLHRLMRDIIKKCADHRELVVSRQVKTIQEWIKGWEGKVMQEAG